MRFGMPKRKKGELPTMRLHKHSGCAFVNVNGKRRYLGSYGSADAQRRYAAMFHKERIEIDGDSLFERVGEKKMQVVDHNSGVAFGKDEGFAGRYPNLPKVWYYPSMMPQEIPDVSAVYFVLNAKCEVLYVGETQSMKRRYREHKKWMRRRHKFSWIEVVPAERLFVQSHFIAALRPIKNRLAGTRKDHCQQGVAMLQPVKLIVKPANRSLPSQIKEATHGR
jgi:hypothetical protein